MIPVLPYSDDVQIQIDLAANLHRQIADISPSAVSSREWSETRCALGAAPSMTAPWPLRPPGPLQQQGLDRIHWTAIAFQGIHIPCTHPALHRGGAILHFEHQSPLGLSISRTLASSARPAWSNPPLRTSEIDLPLGDLFGISLAQDHRHRGCLALTPHGQRDLHARQQIAILLGQIACIINDPIQPQ